MHLKKVDPATLAACGARECDQAVGSISPEYANSLRGIQAARLTRRCAITFAMAFAVAPLLHGERAP